MSDYPQTPWGELQRQKDAAAGVDKPAAKKKAKKKSKKKTG